MGWIGCVRCEKFWCNFMARTSALVAPIQPVLHRVLCSNEILPNTSNTTRRTQTWVQGPMGWIGCVRCEKFWCDIMAWTSALIALVQHVLHRVSCSNETLPNAPKYYETHQNMSLRSNGWIEFVRCQKFRCDFVARSFALIAPVRPVLHRVSCSNETVLNTPKWYEMLQNMRLGYIAVGWEL